MIHNFLNIIKKVLEDKRFLILFSLVFFVITALNVILNIYLTNYTSFFLRMVSYPLVGVISLLLAIDLLVLSQIKELKELRETTRKTQFVFLVVSFITFAIFSITEVYFFGHTLYTPIVMAVCVSVFLFIVLNSEPRISVILIYIPLLIAMLIVAHYITFPPSFGMDTWRDIMWSEETLRTGHFTESRIIQDVYNIPVIVLIYAVWSLLGGLSPVIMSSVVGLMYLLIIGLFITILIKRIYISTKKIELAILFLLLYSTSTITLWSVWFIPQALALLFMLLLVWSFFYKGSSVVFIQVVLALILVFTQPGVALFTLIYLTYLNLFLPENKKFRRFILFMFILFTSYIIYSTVQNELLAKISLYLESILAILSGGAKQQQTAIQLGFFNRVVPFIPLAIAFIFGINTLIVSSLKYVKTNRWEVLTTLFSIGGLMIGFLLTLTAPYTTADRYIGLPSTILLILSSLHGMRILWIAGNSKRVFLYMLAVLLILVLAFGGTFTPLNTITTNPNTYSIHGLVNDRDKIEIQTITDNLDPQSLITIYTDGGTAAFFLNYLLIKYNSDFIYGQLPIKFGNMKIMVFGAFGYYYTGDSSFLYNGSILIYRESSIDMIESWGGLIPNFDHSDLDIIYNSNSIILYAGPQK